MCPKRWSCVERAIRKKAPALRVADETHQKKARRSRLARRFTDQRQKPVPHGSILHVKGVGLLHERQTSFGFAGARQHESHVRASSVNALR
jgi:hypothetical protein